MSNPMMINSGTSDIDSRMKAVEKANKDLTSIRNRAAIYMQASDYLNEGLMDLGISTDELDTQKKSQGQLDLNNDTPADDPADATQRTTNKKLLHRYGMLAKAHERNFDLNNKKTRLDIRDPLLARTVRAANNAISSMRDILGLSA